MFTPAKFYIGFNPQRDASAIETAAMMIEHPKPKKQICSESLKKLVLLEVRNEGYLCLLSC